MKSRVNEMIQKIDEFMNGETHANIDRKININSDKIHLSEDENSNVDNHLITASITLLVTSIGLFYNDIGSNKFSDYILITSACAFLVSFLMFLWNKLRTTIRKKIYIKKHTKWLEDSLFYLRKLMTLVAELTTLRTKVYIYEHAEEIEKLDADQINERIEKFGEDTSNEHDYIINAISYLMSEDARKNYTFSFLKPLDEKHSRVKNIVDQLSKKWRYRSFVIGILFLALGLVVKMIL